MALLWPISARKLRPDITTLPLAKEVRFCAQNQPQITSNVPIKTSMHHLQRTLYQPPDFFNRELVFRFLEFLCYRKEQIQKRCVKLLIKRVKTNSIHQVG